MGPRFSDKELAMSDNMLRLIALAFAVAGWMHGRKKGYSHRGKSFMALLGVMIGVVFMAVVMALL